MFTKLWLFLTKEQHKFHICIRRCYIWHYNILLDVDANCNKLNDPLLHGVLIPTQNIITQNLIMGVYYIFRCNNISQCYIWILKQKIVNVWKKNPFWIVWPDENCNPKCKSTTAMMFCTYWTQQRLSNLNELHIMHVWKITNWNKILVSRVMSFKKF